jgi:serine protease Do
LAAFRTTTEESSASVVTVLGPTRRLASGTVVGPDGWILTRASLLRGASSCRLADGRVLVARLVGVHQGADLALLKVDAEGLVPIRWGRGESLTEGQWVASPGAQREPIAVGVVSVKATAYDAWPEDLHAEDLHADGYLGVRLAAAAGRLLVEHVIRKTPAMEAGIRAGDVLVAVNNRGVATETELVRVLGRHEPGSALTVEIKRDADHLTITLTLGRRPVFARPPDRQPAGGLTLIQHDAWLKADETGGILVDLSGRAVGVDLRAAGRTRNYALTAEQAVPLVREMMAGKWTPTPTDVEMLYSR